MGNCEVSDWTAIYGKSQHRNCELKYMGKAGVCMGGEFGTRLVCQNCITGVRQVVWSGGGWSHGIVGSRSQSGDVYPCEPKLS